MDNDTMNMVAMLESNQRQHGQGSGFGAQPQAAPQPQQFGPQEMLQALNRTQMGHPSYSTGRMTPQGQGGGTNPMTGRPYASYQEYMATRSPEVFAGSMTGRGQMAGPAPPQVPGAQQQPSTMSDYGSMIRQYLGGR